MSHEKVECNKIDSVMSVFSLSFLDDLFRSVYYFERLYEKKNETMNWTRILWNVWVSQNETPMSAKSSF